MDELVFEIESAKAEDAERLAALRIEAMRPSLEAAGRFDPARARARFLDTFEPDETYVLSAEGQLAGFYVLRAREDHLYLDHLYLAPEHQGRGAGRKIVGLVQQQARRLGVPVWLMALNVSDANRFYQSCGFDVVGQDELDTRYVWSPETSAD